MATDGRLMAGSVIKSAPRIPGAAPALARERSTGISPAGVFLIAGAF